jgi:hypothetical protein
MATPESRRSTRPRRHSIREKRLRWNGWSAFFGSASFLLLGLAVIAVVGALSAAGCQPEPSAGAYKPIATRTTTPTPQAAPGEWIPLRSTAAADVLAAARQSSLFQGDQSASGDHADLSRLGNPVLVQAIQPAGAPANLYPDFYVVPILDTSGAATDAAELELNPERTAIQVIAIITYSQPHVDGAIARITASAASAAASAQRGVTLHAGASPDLVYFPADAAALAAESAAWTGGGEYPADPIWRVPGSDGQTYVVGVDGKAYTLDQLPLATPGG